MQPTLYFVPERVFKDILSVDLEHSSKARLFASLARINTLYMVMKAGSGHIGSSFSSMDIFVWLYLYGLSDQDKFFSSKGHDAPGLYSVLIALGSLEFDLLHKLRRLDGLPGHPDIAIPNIITNTGSLGMGVSKAKGFARGNRLKGQNGRIIVLTGDGELQEGQFWEALPGVINAGLNEITVIVDHNKIQSDTWISKVSNLGNLESKIASFGWNVKICNGNDIESLSRAFNEIDKDHGRPGFIIADTVKGKGVSFMESTAMKEGDEFYSYHSGTLSIPEYKRALNELYLSAQEQLKEAGLNDLKLDKGELKKDTSTDPTQTQSLIEIYEKTLHKIGSRNRDVVVLDADLMIDCGLLSFRNSFPDRFFECGIAEQDMVSQAGSLALDGYLPIVHSFAAFLTTRANEQIYNNSTEKTKCVYVGSLAGVLPGGPGHSHQSVCDIATLGSIPNLVLIAPSCEAEVALALEYAVDESKHSTYIRLESVRRNLDFELPPYYRLEFGQGVPLVEGEDILIFAYGPTLLQEAYLASQTLKKNHSISTRLINLPWLNVLDAKWLEQCIRQTRQIYSIDNHLICGGQGRLIAGKLWSTGVANEVTLFQVGLNDTPVCGEDSEVLRYHGLDADSIVNFVLKTIAGVGSKRSE